MDQQNIAKELEEKLEGSIILDQTDSGVTLTCDGFKFHVTYVPYQDRAFVVSVVYGADTDEYLTDVVALDEAVKSINDFRLRVRIDNAVRHGVDLFWGSIAKAFPEIKSGDLTLDAIQAIENTAQDVVQDWYNTNR